MLAEIENAVIARLAAKAPQVKYVDLPRSGAVIAPGPCYMLAITRGDASRPVLDALKQRVELSVWVRVTNLRDDSSRRKGAYPLLEALVQCLFLETLDLDIAPFAYRGFSDVSEPEEVQTGTGIFRLDFETAYTTSKISAVEAADLLAMGLNILLDGKPAIQNEIKLGGSDGDND